MGGGGKGADNGYTPPPAPVSDEPSAEELAQAEENRRAEAERARLERQKQQQAGMLGQSQEEEDQMKKPTLLGG